MQLALDSSLKWGRVGTPTAFVDDILRGRSYLGGGVQCPPTFRYYTVKRFAGMLASQRFPMTLEYLYKRRAPRLLSLDVSGDGGAQRG